MKFIKEWTNMRNFSTYQDLSLFYYYYIDKLNWINIKKKFILFIKHTYGIGKKNENIWVNS